MGLVAGAAAGSGAAASPGCASFEHCDVGAVFMGAATGGSATLESSGASGCAAAMLLRIEIDGVLAQSRFAAVIRGRMRLTRPGEQLRHQQHEQRHQNDGTGQSLLGSRIHGANYSPRNSSAGPTVRNEPNTSTRSPGRAAARAVRQASATSPACASTEALAGNCAAICCVLTARGPAERDENPAVDVGGQRLRDAADVLVTEDAAHRQRAPRARQAPQVVAQHLGRGHVVGDVENPFHLARHALKPAGDAHVAQGLRDSGP